MKTYENQKKPAVYNLSNNSYQLMMITYGESYDYLR